MNPQLVWATYILRRRNSRKCAWELIGLKGTGGSRTDEADRARQVDKSKTENQPLRFAEEQFLVWELIQDTSKGQPLGHKKGHTAAQKLNKSRDKEPPQQDKRKANSYIETRERHEQGANTGTCGG